MKACRHCYISNSDDLTVCRSCGRSLRRSMAPTLLGFGGLIIAAGVAAAVFGLRGRHAPAEKPAPPRAAESREDLRPLPAPAAISVPTSVESEMPPAQNPPEPADSPATAKSADPHPEAPASTESTEPAPSPSGPRPRKRVAPPPPNTADILRGDEDQIAIVGNLAEEEARYEASVWRAVLREFGRLDNFWERLAAERIHVVVRVDAVSGATELVRAPAGVTGPLLRDIEIAVSRSSGAVACPDELRRHFGNQLEFTFEFVRGQSAAAN
ncbi:MAG TPA: hypothetical protein VGM73_16740 [Candidatus Didemnitutus sp.]